MDNPKRAKLPKRKLEARKMTTAVEMADRTSSLQEQIENFVRSGDLELKGSHPLKINGNFKK